MANNLVGIIMGSDSDLEVMKEAAKILEEFKVPFEITVERPIECLPMPKRLKVKACK
jgi:phosphoribosylcarboxyaminoimidazole (NCAIR) mutase